MIYIMTLKMIFCNAWKIAQIDSDYNNMWRMLFVHTHILTHTYSRFLQNFVYIHFIYFGINV